jgi:hypothetical protein
MDDHDSRTMDDAFKRVFIFYNAESRTSLHAEFRYTIIAEAVPDAHVKLRLTRRCSLRSNIHHASTYDISTMVQTLDSNDGLHPMRYVLG